MLYLLYAVYLPIAILVELANDGFKFTIISAINDFWKILYTNYGNLGEFFRFAGQPLFGLDCRDQTHTLFSISFFKTFQLLAVET